MQADYNFDYDGWMESSASMPDHMVASACAYLRGLTEQRRREAVASEAAAAVIGELVEAGTITGPEAVTRGSLPDSVEEVPVWVDPGTNHSKMFRYGQITRNRGRAWESMVQGLNHWEPGGPGVYDMIWRDVTDELFPAEDNGEEPGEGPGEESVAEFVQPTHAGDAYKSGARVRWQGDVYVSLIDANVWSPAAYPAGWRKES